MTAPALPVEIETTGLSLLTLLAVGGVLLLVLAAIGYAIRLAPMSRSRRELIARASPLVATVVLFAYLLFAAGELFKAHPASVPFALALLLFGFGAASWFAIRDFLAGVFIKAGRVCEVGDHIQIGEVKGRVQRMGLRVVSVETIQGDEAIIPYSRIAKESLLRTPVLDGVALHVFRLDLPAGAATADLRRVVRDSALSCHWSSVVREPELVSVPPHGFEVTVFALDTDHGPDVESAVRSAVERRFRR